MNDCDADALEKIEQILTEFCQQILEGKHDQFQLPIPPFLKEFVKRQIPFWIQ